MDEMGNEWPPVDINQFLERAGITEKLETIKSDLMRRGFDEASVLDALQELFMEVLGKSYDASREGKPSDHPLLLFDRFKAEEDWWSYYFAVSANRLKRKKKDYKIQTNLMEDISDLRAVSDEVLNAEEPLSLPAGSLAELELKQRAVFILIREGFTQGEIGTLMRISPGRVSQLKSAAVKSLQAITRRLGRSR